MSKESFPPLLQWSLIGAVGFALFIVLISVTMARTSSMDFCLSCHEMERYKTELEKSSHAVDEDKKAMECRQCHIPNQFGLKYLTVKTVSGLRDMWVHNFGDPKNLDRRALQDTARRFIVDDNCRHCHQDLFKTVKHEPLSEIGRLSHEAYLGRNGNTKRGCAGCHFNMAHLPDFDRRYTFNAQFSQNLPLFQE